MRAEFDQVGHQLHRWLGREHKFILGMEFLENIVLNRPSQLLPVKSALPGGGQIEGHEHDGWSIDGHRNRSLREVDAIVQGEHVVERIDGHPQSPHLANASRIVTVESHQGR